MATYSFKQYGTFSRESMRLLQTHKKMLEKCLEVCQRE